MAKAPGTLCGEFWYGLVDFLHLSQLSEETIWEKLKNRIYDSTLTIVMLSKGMREQYKEEKDQWIPREISYSLKEMSRTDSNGNPVTSKTNALMVTSKNPLKCV